MAVLLFTNQHVTQRNSELRRKPSVRREVLRKIASAPRQDAELETGVGGAGMQQQRIEFLHRELLIAADGLGFCVLHREVMMEPAAVAVSHDAFLVFGARSVESGRHHWL